jgi:type II secretory pathway pseudopilin PulG
MIDIQIAFVDVSRKDTQDGFTMVEILIAMTLFIFGILTLMELHTASIRHIAAARIQTEATAIGKQLIEHLRLLPVDHPDLNSSCNPHEPKRGTDHSYSIQWEILDDPITKGIRILKVIVSPYSQIYGKPVVIHTILGSEEIGDDE